MRRPVEQKTTVLVVTDIPVFNIFVVMLVDILLVSEDRNKLVISLFTACRNSSCHFAFRPGLRRPSRRSVPFQHFRTVLVTCLSSLNHLFLQSAHEYYKMLPDETAQAKPYRD